MKKREYIMIAIIFVLGFIVLRGCNQDLVARSAVDILTDKDLKPDTVFVEGEKIRVPYPVPYPVKEYVNVAPDSLVDIDFVENDSTGVVDTVNTHVTNFSDTILDAVIKSRVIGRLLSTDFTYVPKSFVRQVDTVEITKPVAVDVPKRSLYGGGVIGGNGTMFNFQPVLLLKTKTDLIWGGGYDIIHKTYHVHLYTKINNPFKKKKKL